MRAAPGSSLFLTKDTFYQFPTSYFLTLFHCEKLLRTIEIDNLSCRPGVGRMARIECSVVMRVLASLTAGPRMKTISVNLLLLADER